MSVLIVLASVLPVLLVGDLILGVLAPRGDYGLGERLPIALLFGGGFVSLALFYASRIDFRHAMDMTMGAVALLVGTALVRFWNRRGPLTWSWARPRFGSDLPFALLIAIPFVVAIVALWIVALSTDLGFDGLVTWALKAKVAAVEGGWPSSYFADPLRAVSHQDYPLFVPGVEAWAWRVESRVDEAALKLLFPLFYLGLLSLFYATLRREFSSSYSLLFTALLGSTPYLTSLAAVSGYADIPLMLSVFGAMVFVQRWMRNGARSDLLVGATLAALGVWTKREGAVYWLMTLIAVLTYAGWRKDFRRAERVRAALLYCIPAAVVFAPWLVFLAHRHVPNSDFAPVSAAGLIANLDRLPVILNHLVAQFFGFGSWGVLWVLFGLMLMGRRRALSAFATSYGTWITIVPLTLLSLSFVFSVWQPFMGHLETALDRLVMQAVPLAWYWIASQSGSLDDWLKSKMERGAATSRA